MSKNSSKAFLLVFITIASFFILTTLQKNDFTPFSGLNLNPKQDSSLIDIKILESNAPNITNWKFNGTPFTWSDLLYCNVNETSNLTVTVIDDTAVKNVTLWYDTELSDYAGPEYTLMTPIQNATTLPADDNNTITSIIPSATNFINDTTATNTSGDGIYHRYANGSIGILMPYAINLSSHNPVGFNNIYSVNISIRAYINNTSGVTWAGWQIWNNNTRQLDDINGQILNSTQNVTDSVILIGNNLTNYYDSTNNSRIEIFFNITSSNPVELSVDYIGFNVSYGSDNYTADFPRFPWQRIAWDGFKWIYTPPPPSKVYFWVVAYDIFNNQNSTKKTPLKNNMNYTMVDLINPTYQLSVQNGSYVGKVARITMRGIDFESGISKMTLAIDGIVTENRTWTNATSNFLSQDPYFKNISVYYDWNVTSYLTYNGSSGTNATHTINFTIWDRGGNSNSTGNLTIFVDNLDPYGAYLNLRTNELLDLNATCKINNTITNTILNATNFKNSVTATYQLDNISHGYTNGSAGILMAYAVELKDYNLSILDNVYSVNVSVVANISTTSGVSWAGLQIWNWTAGSLQTINSTIFNSTTPVLTWFIITRENSTRMGNLTNFISESRNCRIEFFINITCSDQVNASVDYIRYYVKYFKTLDVYSDFVVDTNLSVRVGGYDNYSLDKFVLYANNQQVFWWNASFNASAGIDNFYFFNSSDLPNGQLTLNLTVFDKAGNTNYTTFTTKIDNLGPSINFTSLQNGSIFTSSGSWNFIVPVTFFATDNITSVQKVELYINGVLGEVLPGQQGQVFEYDAYGNLIYIQQNATWFKDGTFTYYWNASIYQTGSQHNLTLVAVDIMGNSANYSIFVNKTNYNASVSIKFLGFAAIPYVQTLIYVSYKITNTGNCTLFDFDLSLHFYFLNKTWTGLEMGWVSVIQLGDVGKLSYLSPGESITVEFLIYGLEYYSPGYFELFMNISARSIETFIFATSKYQFAKNQLILSASPPYERLYSDILPYVIVYLSAFGAGVLLHILIRRIQLRYKKLEEVYAEKLKKENK